MMKLPYSLIDQILFDLFPLASFRR